MGGGGGDTQLAAQARHIRYSGHGRNDTDSTGRTRSRCMLHARVQGRCAFCGQCGNGSPRIFRQQAAGRNPLRKKPPPVFPSVTRMLSSALYRPLSSSIVL